MILPLATDFAATATGRRLSERMPCAFSNALTELLAGTPAADRLVANLDGVFGAEALSTLAQQLQKELQSPTSKVSLSQATEDFTLLLKRFAKLAIEFLQEPEPDAQHAAALLKLLDVQPQDRQALEDDLQSLYDDHTIITAAAASSTQNSPAVDIVTRITSSIASRISPSTQLASRLCQGGASRSDLEALLQKTFHALTATVQWASRQWAHGWSRALEVGLCADNLQGPAGPHRERLMAAELELKAAGVLVKVVDEVLDAFLSTQVGVRYLQLVDAGTLRLLQAPLSVEALQEALYYLASNLDVGVEVASFAARILDPLEAGIAEHPGEDVGPDVVKTTQALLGAVLASAQSLKLTLHERHEVMGLFGRLEQLLGEWEDVADRTACDTTTTKPRQDSMSGPVIPLPPRTPPSFSSIAMEEANHEGGLATTLHQSFSVERRSAIAVQASLLPSPPPVYGSPSPSPSSPPANKTLAPSWVIPSPLTSNSDLRLAEGSSNSSGRLEVLLNGTWGTVCSTGFGPNEAKVGCRQLGFTDGTAYTHGGGSGPVWLESLWCNPKEHKLLDQCYFKHLGSNCSHDLDVGLNCTLYLGDIRLDNSTSTRSGVLQVFATDAWVPICFQGFSDLKAKVICSQLGFQTGWWFSEGFGTGIGGSLVNSTACEEALSQASSPVPLIPTCNITWDPQACDSSDVSIHCEDDPAPNALRIAHGDKVSRGRVEVFHNDSWGTLCYYGFNTEASNVLCRQLGYGSGEVYGVLGGGPGVVLSDNVTCNSSQDTRLEQCANFISTVVNPNCTHDNDVAVTCSAPAELDVRLADGTARNNGRLEVWRQGAWRTVCANNFTRDEATTVCRQLGYTSYSGKPYIHGCGRGNRILTGFKCPSPAPNVAIKALQDCWPPADRLAPWVPNDFSGCTHDRDVGVYCLAPNETYVSPYPATCQPYGPAVEPHESDLRLSGGANVSSGRIEMYRNGSWATFCYVAPEVGGQQLLTVALVACRQLGYSNASATFSLSNGTGIILTDAVACNGTEAQLDQCVWTLNPSAASWNCTHDADLALTCTGPVFPSSGPSPSPSPSPDPSYGNGTSGACSDGMAVLDSHNTLRALHSAPAMVWDTNLEASAKAWALNLSRNGCKLVHSGGVSENLWAMSGASGDRCNQSTGAWYSEQCNYKFTNTPWTDNSAHFGSIGHFTQLVWKASTRLGCAYGKNITANCQVVVCQYQASGNYVDDGSFLENVAPNNGTPAINCPAVPSPTPSPTPTPGPTPNYVVGRLVGGWTPYTGRVEINIDGEWGTVCVQPQDDMLLPATTACRQLGYRFGYPYIAGGGNLPILVGNVSCPMYSPWGLGGCDSDPPASSCNHDMDAGAYCMSDPSMYAPNKYNFRSLAKKVFAAVQNVLPASMVDLLRASPVLRDVPRFIEWIGIRVDNGMFARMYEQQLGVGVVKEVLDPVVRKALNTTTGSIIIDAFMAKTDLLRKYLDAMTGSYDIILSDWINGVTFDVALETLTEVVEMEDSRLSVEGFIRDGGAILHTLLGSLTSSVSNTGALKQALYISTNEEARLVYFFTSMDELLTAGMRVIGFPESPAGSSSGSGPSTPSPRVKDIFFNVMKIVALVAQNPYRGARQMFVNLVVYLVRTMELLPSLYEWIDRTWSMTAVPVLEILSHAPGSNPRAVAFARAQVQPVLDVLGSIMEALLDIGVGDAVRATLNQTGILVVNGSHVPPDEILKILERTARNNQTSIEQDLAFFFRSPRVLRDEPPHTLLRDTLLVLETTVRSVMMEVTSPYSPFGLAVGHIEGPYMYQEDRLDPIEFWSLSMNLRAVLDQAVIMVRSYPDPPPIPALVGSYWLPVGNSMLNITFTLHMTEHFRLTHIGNNGSVCVLLIPNLPHRGEAVSFSATSKCVTEYTSSDDGAFALFTVTFPLLAFNVVSPSSGSAEPPAVAITADWYIHPEMWQVAYSLWEIPVKTSAIVPLPSPSPSGSPPPITPCQACQACLDSLSPALTELLAATATLTDPMLILSLVFETIGDSGLPNLVAVQSRIATLVNGGSAVIVARAGFLCALSGACPTDNSCSGLKGMKADGSAVSITGALDYCTVEGIQGGTWGYQPGANNCRVGSECVNTGLCASVNTLDVPGMWSFNTCFATGQCVNYCDLNGTVTGLANLNSGITPCDPSVLASSSSACGANQYCMAATFRGCRTYTCDRITQKLVENSCSGLCQPRALEVVNATLSDDGREVVIVLNAPAMALTDVPCGRIFDAATLVLMGGTAAVCNVLEAYVAVELAPGASLVAGSTLAFLSSGSALVWLYDSSVVFKGSVKVAGCTGCKYPVALVSGPVSIAQPCASSTSSLATSVLSVDFDASVSTDPSGRPFIDVRWEVLNSAGSSDVSRAALQAAVDRANGRSNIRERLLLTITPSEVSAMDIASGYRIQVIVRSWLSTSDTRAFTFSKTSASTTPAIVIPGPSVQAFSIRRGIRSSATVSTSCSGKVLLYQWSGQNTAAAALLTGVTTTAQQLYIAGPVSGVVHGQKVPLRVSATYTNSASGVEPAVADVTFVAVGSDPVAQLTGPSGDWPEGSPLVFNATSSLDPDVSSTAPASTLSYSWSCSRADDPSTPCFSGLTLGGDTTSKPGVWTLPSGTLAVDKWYAITVTVSKATAAGTAPLTSTTSTIFRPRSVSVVFPRGELYRECSSAGCSGLHNTDRPLVVTLLLASTAASATSTWTCDAIPTLNIIAQQQITTANATGATRTISISAALLPTTLAKITITVTLNLDGVDGVVKLTVGLNSPPYCSLDTSNPISCLSLDIVNNTAPYAVVVARASGWADSQDDQLRYEFGVREGITSPDEVRARGTASSAKLVGLSAGDWGVYVCAIDSEGSRSCVSRNVTIQPPPANFNPVAALAELDITAIAASNDMGALLDMANLMSAMLASMGNSSSGGSSGTTASGVVAKQATAMATALLASLANIQDPEQIATAMSSLASMASSAAEVLPDDARGVYAQAAQKAIDSILSANTATSVTELVNTMNDICRLLSTYLPRGKSSGSTRRSMLAATVDGLQLFATSSAGRNMLAVSAAVESARNSLVKITTLGQQMGVALGRQATPGATYIAGGDQGVYVSAAVFAYTVATSAQISLRAGATAAVAASGGLTNAARNDAEAQVVLSGASATAAASYGVILQYAPTSSTAVSLAATDLLTTVQTPRGGLMTVSWIPPSTASATAANPALGSDSYVLIWIPAPGYNITHIGVCTLYDVNAATVTEEAGSFVEYNATTGNVKCRVTKMGSYFVTQGAVIAAGSIAPPPPPPPSTVVLLITMTFKLSNTSKVATQAQQDAFKAGLTSALANIYQVSASAVTLTSISPVRSDNTIRVWAAITIPASRGADGGAAAGFESDPMSKLPASFISEFSITQVSMQRGNVEIAVVGTQSGSDAGIGAGAIAGIVIGSVVGVLLIGAFVVVLIRRRSHQRVTAAQGRTSVQAFESGNPPQQQQQQQVV